MKREFRDVPLTDPCTVSVFRYRKDGKLKKYSVVEMPDAKFYLKNTAETQLMNLLGLSIRSLEHEDWKARNEIVNEALLKRLTEKKQIILRTIDETCYAVVTDAFTDIPNYIVWDLVEKTFKVRGIQATRQFIKLNSKSITKYIFKDGNRPIRNGIMITNSRKGLASLSLAKYFEIVVCANGLIDATSEVVFSRVHRGSEDEILAGFAASLETMLDSLEVIEPERFKNTVEDVEDFVNGLPIAKKYKERVLEDMELIFDASYWDIANSLSTVAKLAPPATRIELEKLSFAILKGNQKGGDAYQQEQNRIV